MKGLLIYVYRDCLGDCTNGGVSSKFDRLTLIGEGIDGVFEPTPDAPAVTMVVKYHQGIENEPYKSLVPCDNDGKPFEGWFMFGGNYGKTSDSRFPHKYPLPIHDRQEW